MRIKQKYSSRVNTILPKKKKMCKTLNNFCNVERYPTVIWTCQNSNVSNTRMFLYRKEQKLVVSD